MLVNLLIFINVLIFCFISGLHFYWAFGGQWAAKGAVPERFHEMAFKEKGKLIPTIPTLIVAFGLLGFALVTASHAGVFELGIPPTYIRYATWAMAFIFTARAIGDFNFMGFFKKDKRGLFAERDSKIYSPLCLYLGMSLAVILVF